jgi:hypothetical protein
MLDWLPFSRLPTPERWTAFWETLARRHESRLNRNMGSGDFEPCRSWYRDTPPRKKGFPECVSRAGGPVLFDVFDLLGLEGVREAVALGADIRATDFRERSLLFSVSTPAEFSALVEMGLSMTSPDARDHLPFDVHVANPAMVRTMLDLGFDVGQPHPLGVSFPERIDQYRQSTRSPVFLEGLEEVSVLVDAGLVKKALSGTVALPDTRQSPRPRL